jgi:hypothetical protein
LGGHWVRSAHAFRRLDGFCGASEFAEYRWLTCQIAANPIRRRCTLCLAVITLAGKSGCEKNCISMQFQRIMERGIWWAGLFALVPAKDAPPPVSRFTHYETLLARALQMRESTKTSG